MLHIGLQVGDGRGEVGPDDARCRDHRKEETWDEGGAAAVAVYDGVELG